jgi:hypothetical protein
MKKLLILAISVVFGMSMFFAYAGPATAGEEMMAQGAACANPSFSGASHDSGYMGALVLDPQNNELGRVFDVTSGIDGQINFLVVYSCLPGMADKLVAVPVWDTDIPQRVGTVTVSITKEQFLGAPGVTSQEYSDLGFRWSRWFEDNHTYFEKTY